VNLKALGLVSLLTVVGGILTVNYGSIYRNSPSTTEPCTEPLTYQFGDIDSRFDITEQKLSETMKEVERLWATAMDQQVLEYRKDGKVVIHLIYGEEQKRTESEQLLTNEIQTKKDQIEVLEEEYENLRTTFQEKQKDFESTLAEYNEKAREYSELANKWKGKKIPEETYKKLKQMEKEIKLLRPTVERKKDTMEMLSQKTNTKSRKLNRLIDIQNELISKYNNRFGVAKKFNQGRYFRKGDDERINIFQFSNIAQLKTVLAHEAGHAMGLDHVENNPQSIMYPIMGKQNIFDLSLTDEDIAALKNHCSSL